LALNHVSFFHIENGDICARDTGREFNRSRSGKLFINDWNFSI
jgi:agmatine/peptidylarginine deiminase